MKIQHLTFGIYWHLQLYNVLPFIALEHSPGREGLKVGNDKEGEKPARRRSALGAAQMFRNQKMLTQPAWKISWEYTALKSEQ